MVNPLAPFTTHNEISFIRYLGSFCEIPQADSRMTLLRGYKKALAKRVNWGIIDRVEVISYLDRAIAKEGGNALH